MPEEQERNPKLDLKDIPLLGSGIKVKLDCAEPIKSGQSKYGTWNIWVGFVEKLKVHEGRGVDDKVIEGYTGKVIFFPTENLNKKLVETCNGNLEVEVLIKKTVREGRRGLIREYVIEKLSDGRPPQASLTPTELKLIEDAEKLVAKGFKLDEPSFIKASQEDMYEGKVSENRARYLFTLLKWMSI